MGLTGALDKSIWLAGLLAVSVIFSLLGYFDYERSTEKLARIEAIPHLEVPDNPRILTQAAACTFDAVVVTEGPKSTGGFVAWLSQRYDGKDQDDDPIWTAQEGTLPRLRLDWQGELVDLENTDYSLLEPMEPWVQDPGRATPGETTRHRGLLPKQAVMVHGIFLTDHKVHALGIYGAPRAETTAWLESRRDASLGLIGFVLGSIATVLLAGWMVWRSQRQAAARRRLAEEGVDLLAKEPHEV